MNLTKAEIKQLKDKKFRKQNNLFMVEGEKFCFDVLHSGVKILYTITSNKNLTEFPNICVVSEQVLSGLASTVTNQNIICVCEFVKPNIESVGNCLILDNLQDPGNVGTLIRSALAFGFKDIYLVGGADAFSEKVIRSSAGLVLQTRVHVVGFEEILNNKTKIAKHFYVADMDGENINQTPLPKGRVAVVVGNEGNGVSQEFLRLADKKISIPMQPCVESLNAGVAGSIIMQKLSEVK